MVITDVPFDAREKATKKSRYNLIRRPDSAIPGALPADSDEEEDPEARRSKEYASFLK